MSKFSGSLFPITKESVIGIPTNASPKGFSIVLANDDGEILFIFPDGNNKTQPCSKGQGFEITAGCTGVTSIISVTMS